MVRVGEVEQEEREEEEERQRICKQDRWKREKISVSIQK